MTLINSRTCTETHCIRPSGRVLYKDPLWLYFLTIIMLELNVYWGPYKSPRHQETLFWRGTDYISMRISNRLRNIGGQLHQRDSSSNLGSRLNLIVCNNICYCCRQSSWALSLSLSLSHVGATGPGSEGIPVCYFSKHWDISGGSNIGAITQSIYPVPIFKISVHVLSKLK